MQQNAAANHNLQQVQQCFDSLATLRVSLHEQECVYTLQSSRRSVHLFLTATPYSPVLNISVDLKACPTGFALNNGTCKCNHALIQEGIGCFINNQSILHPANTWIGFSTCLDNSSESAPTCTCCSCSHWQPLVLVAVFFVLNLTVTEGSINGLIFYANVISMSQYFDTSSKFYTFIAWLNLDLGIDTCFYGGMDAYAETWLQFAFPLYLWLIIAWGTQNAVKVLATLLLLSYTKLQQILVTIFSFSTLRYPSGAVQYVWLYNANVHYLKGKHIYLFVAMVCWFLVS